MQNVVTVPARARDKHIEMPSTHRYLNISDAASLLGVSRVSIWRWIRAGLLPARRLGHRTVLPADASYSTKLELNVKSS